MAKIREWSICLVLVICVSCVWGQDLPPLPEVSFKDSNRPVAIQNIKFTLDWSIAYQGDADYVGVTKLYQKLVHNGVTIYDEVGDVSDDSGFVLEGKAPEIIINERGWQTVDLFVSYTADFAVSNNATRNQWYVPGGVTLLPPIVVIVIAFWTREVIYALYLGIFFACFIIKQYNPFAAFLITLDTYIVQSIGNVDHAFVLLFTWLLSGLIACIAKSGGTFGIANVFAKFAKTRMSVQLIIFILGFIIFFDDYANTLILGNTMRVVSDALMISREKLSFLVDATTAPVASIAPISSWIGFEVGLIQQQLDNLEAKGVDITTLPSAYLIFLQTIPSRFYPIFMLWFQFTSIICRREWGPMLVAERRAYDEGKLVSDTAKVRDESEDTSLLPSPDTPCRWWNGFVPILLVVTLVLTAILLTGRTKTIQDQEDAIAAGLPPPPLDAQHIFGNGDSYASLTYGSLFTMWVAWAMYRFQYVLDGHIILPFKYWIKCQKAPGHPLRTMEENLEAMIIGIKQIFGPVLVLILAWAVGASITDSGADIFFASALGGGLDPRLLPTLTFIIASIISLCTGTSWGTMSILFPLVIPAAYEAAPDNQPLFILTISAILAGAVFGDHCTPISDTTILSAISSQCDVMHHAITQAPYAVLTAIISLLLGYLPVGYEAYPNWGGLLIGGLFMLFVVLFVGVRVDHPKRKLDPLTQLIEWIVKKLHKKKPGEEDEEVQKPVHVYNPDDELTYVDILRPKTFFNRDAWRRKPAAETPLPAEKKVDDEENMQMPTDNGEDDVVSQPEKEEISPAENVSPVVPQ